MMIYPYLGRIIYLLKRFDIHTGVGYYLQSGDAYEDAVTVATSGPGVST